MALSATPRLIKRKQIHGAPGGGKKLQWVDSRRDTWEAEGTKNKCFGSALWQLLASWMTHSLRGRYKCIIPRLLILPLSLRHFFLHPPFPKLGISERLPRIGIADLMRDLECTWGHLKIWSWRRIWKGWKNNWDARCPLWSPSTYFSSRYSKKLNMWL